MSTVPYSTPASVRAPKILSPLVNGLFSMFSPGGAAGRLSILLFHKVPTVADPLTPDELDLQRFEHILDLLARHTNVMPLSEASSRLQQGKLPRRATAITFDDGYAEWLENVSPALRKRHLPATFFVTTGQLAGPSLWHERIMAAVRALPDAGGTLPTGMGDYADLHTAGRRVRLINDLQARLKYASVTERVTAIAALEAQAASPLVLARGFDADSVRLLHSQGFEIGAHTVEHPILNECTRSQARDEIGRCKAELEAIISAPVTSFAYPNGRPYADYKAEHVEMVRECGYHTAVSTSAGAAGRGADLLQLPRFTPWGLTDERIALQLARNMVTRPTTINPPPRKHDGHLNQAGQPSAAVADSAATDVRCLLIASTFPPIHGGSAVVYDNLCRYMPAGSIRVLTASTNYMHNTEVAGWQAHDDTCPYPVTRARLLRPLIARPPRHIVESIYRLVALDIPLYARALLAAGKLVRKHDINVVCIGELVAGTWLGIALRKLFKTRLIIYVHGEEITTITGGRFSGNQRKNYLHAADKIVAVSAFTCDAMKALMDVPREAVKLIQNGVDTDQFFPADKPADLLAKHQLHGKQIVLTIGRMVARKGIDNAVRAIALVLKTRPQLHYLIVGEGDLREEIVALISSHGIAGQVTLVGKVSQADLVRYLQLCDLFLMPNRTLADGDTEGFGLVFREANACRKPVIGGRAGGVVEAVIDGYSGLLVDGYKVDEIAAAVERILGDPVLAEQLAANGLQLARENNTRSVALAFLKTCQQTLRQPARK